MREWLRLLIHGERRNSPRTDESHELIKRQLQLQQRVRRLELELQLRRRHR